MYKNNCTKDRNQKWNDSIKKSLYCLCEAVQNYYKDTVMN